MFCLVDVAAGRCLRTIENPTLLRTSASWEEGVLSVEMPSGPVVGEPVRTGDVLKMDYWGRTAEVQLVEGPWAAAYSTFLGREVVMAVSAPGEVVYGGSVTLVTNTSLSRLGAEVGGPVDGARFRATFQLDGSDLEPHAEDGWVGRRLRLGAAEIRVRGLVPRCGVIDLCPASGARDLGLLKALARRGGAREVTFGLDADVTKSGWVTTGDPVAMS